MKKMCWNTKTKEQQERRASNEAYEALIENASKATFFDAVEAFAATYNTITE